jgi:HAMP domain-containing protein
VGLGFAARLAIATSGLIIGACLLLSWLLVRHDLAEIHRGLVDRGQTIVEYLAHDAELSVLSGDRTELRQLAEMARAQRDVLYCRFFDRDGEPLVAIGQPEGTPLPAEVSATTGPIAIGADVWEFRAPIFTTDLRPRREELEFFAGETAHAGEARQRVGTVTIGIALAPLRAHRRESFLAAVAFTGLVAFAASLIAVVWARAVTRPLQALARAADAIGQGSFGITVQVDTGDELAALAESFNEMAVSLAQSHSTVAEYSRTLEARTERLEAVNRELEEANHLKSEFSPRCRTSSAPRST